MSGGSGATHAEEVGKGSGGGWGGGGRGDGSGGELIRS